MFVETLLLVLAFLVCLGLIGLLLSVQPARIRIDVVIRDERPSAGATLLSPDPPDGIDTRV